MDAFVYCYSIYAKILHRGCTFFLGYFCCQIITNTFLFYIYAVFVGGREN